MQTIQEHPGRCLGCLVVAATEAVPPSPVIAALASASRPEAEDSWSGLQVEDNLCLFNSTTAKHKEEGS